MPIGKVKWYDTQKKYGFLVSETEGDIFVHSSVLQRAGISALNPNDMVEFEFERPEKGRPQATSIVFVGSSTPSPSTVSPAPEPSAQSVRFDAPDALKHKQFCLPPQPGTSRSPGLELGNWAYLWHIPKRSEFRTERNIPQPLLDLEALARPEKWSFDAPKGPNDRTYPAILENYLTYTFYRLKIEQQVLVSDIAGRPISAFNTGLVDRRFEPIYAVFEENRHDNSRHRNWRLSGFCISSEDRLGKDLRRGFKDLPRVASYFDNLSDLIFDARGTEEVDFDKNHVVLDNVHQLPAAFIEDSRPPGFEIKNTSRMSKEERNDYFNRLADAIDGHDRTNRIIVSRFKDAIRLAVKRIRWNFKTAIPQYYPVKNSLSLLLPLGLLSDENPDVALAHLIHRPPFDSLLRGLV